MHMDILIKFTSLNFQLKHTLFAQMCKKYEKQVNFSYGAVIHRACVYN